MIGFTVLGGYLGAGKTTLLNQILRRNTESADPIRIALLVNDFGDINIDAQLIESQIDSQINLANGCVCCTLTDGFSAALDTLVDLNPQPEHIIVEASGVADVNNLSQYGNGQVLALANIVVVADAETVQEKASDKYVAKTIQRQLKAADLILLNKVDLLEPQIRERRLSWLSELTDGIPVVPCVRGDIPQAILFELERRDNPIDESVHGHEEYVSWSYGINKRISRESLEAFADSLGPGVLRCKGVFVDPFGYRLELQVVGKRKEVAAGAKTLESVSQLVAIGLKGKMLTEDLDAAVQRLFHDAP